MVDISLRSACFKQSCSLAVAYLSLTNRRWNHHPSSVLASAGFTTYRCCFELSEIYQGSSERADKAQASTELSSTKQSTGWYKPTPGFHRIEEITSKILFGSCFFCTLGCRFHCFKSLELVDSKLAPCRCMESRDFKND